MAALTRLTGMGVPGRRLARVFVGTATLAVQAALAEILGVSVGYLGVGVVTGAAATAEATGSVTPPSYTGTADVAVEEAVAEAAGTHTAPTYAGTADVDVEEATADGVGVGVAAGYAASGDVAVSAATAEATGTHADPPIAGTADVTTAAVTATGEGETVSSGGVADITTAAVTVTGEGTQTGPVYAATGVTTVAVTTVVGVGGMYTGIFGEIEGFVGTVVSEAYGGAFSRTHTGRFAIRRHEQLYWLPAGNRLPPDLLLTGIACGRSGRLCTKSRNGEVVSRLIDAGAVVRGNIKAVVWAKTTARVLLVVRKRRRGA